MKIISKLNLKIDVDAARQYYAELEKNFQHLKWIAPVGPVNLHGWSVHGIKNKPAPWPFMDPTNEPPGLENYFNTELVFGWAKEILELFPYGYRAAIGESPPGTVIPAHIDLPETHLHMVRLQIPVYTNKECIWTTADGDLNLEVGNAYIVDTSFEHGTRNFGTTRRVHFAMCIPRSNIDDIKKFF